MWRPQLGDVHNTLVQTHREYLRVQVLVDRQVTETIVSPVAGTPTMPTGEFGITGCTIRCDGASWSRWTLENLTVVDRRIPSQLAARRFGDTLAAPNELKIDVGVLVSGATTWIPMGVYRISDHSVDASATDVTIQVTGYDRMREVARRSWPRPYIVPKAIASDVAIADGIRDRYPDANVQVTDPADSLTPSTPPLTWGVNPGNNPAEEMNRYARAYGREVFCDRLGNFEIRPVPDAATQPLLTLPEPPGGHIWKTAQRTLSDDPGYNGVVGVAEGPQMGAPAYSEMWDDDPQSPTYRGDPPGTSPWGEIPKAFITQEANSQTDLDAAVAAEFSRLRGGRELLSASGLPFYPLDVDDVIGLVHVTHGWGCRFCQTGINGNWTVASIIWEVGVAMQVNFQERPT